MKGFRSGGSAILPAEELEELQNGGIPFLKVQLKWENRIPADTDVFKTSSGRLKKVTTSYDQTRRRHDVWKKTSHF